MAVCSWEQQLARLAEQRLRYSQGSPGLPPANPGRITPSTYFPFDCSSENSSVQPTLACVTVCMCAGVHVCAGRAWRTSRHCSSVTLNLLTGLDQLASQPPKSACLCLPTGGDNRSPPPALTLFGLIWGFCYLCVCFYIYFFCGAPCGGQRTRPGCSSPGSVWVLGVDWTQLVRFEGKRLYLRSHLAAPQEVNSFDVAEMEEYEQTR